MLEYRDATGAPSLLELSDSRNGFDGYIVTYFTIYNSQTFGLSVGNGGGEGSLSVRGLVLLVLPVYRSLGIGKPWFWLLPVPRTSSCSLEHDKLILALALSLPLSVLSSKEDPPNTTTIPNVWGAGFCDDGG